LTPSIAATSLPLGRPWIALGWIACFSFPPGGRRTVEALSRVRINDW